MFEVFDQLYSSYKKVYIFEYSARFENENWFETVPLTPEVAHWILLRGVEVIYE